MIGCYFPYKIKTIKMPSIATTVNRRAFKIIFQGAVYVFALIGFFLTVGFIAIRLGWTKTSGIVDKQHDYFKDSTASVDQALNQGWAQSPEWQILEVAIAKDAPDIIKASNVAGVDPRLTVGPLVAEQLRLFTSEREIFKQIFSPLKILGVQSQYSWGVMGIKQDTAIRVESNLTATSSDFYLGPSYEHLLDFQTSDHDSERFARLTDSKNRYYSYLYSALYIREIIEQWKKAGFDISDRPEVIATLYNIGFNNSRPNVNPSAGGAEIDVNGTTYSFGGLAGEFYRSNELTAEFPILKKSILTI